MKKPRILAISFLFPNSKAPDYGVFVLNRLKALSRDFEIKVINPVPVFPLSFMFRKYRPFSGVPKREIIGGMEVYHPRFFIVPGFFKFLDAISFLAAVLPLAVRLRNRFEFDLIDLHWCYPDLPSGRLLSRLTGKKQLVTIRGKEALHPGEKSFRRWMIRSGISKSDAVIALSRELAEDARTLGAQKKQITIIRNGVDLDRFYLIDQWEARKRLGLGRSDYILISVGSLIHRKGHDRAVSAMKSVLAVNPGAKLYILGDPGPEGNFRRELAEQVRKEGVEDQVVFQGHIPHEELMLWYNAADLFCLLSRGEGSPNVLTEALACGCPSIACNVGAVDEIMDQPFLGDMAPEDQAGISAVLARAAARAWDRHRIADHMKSFGWDWCAGQVAKVYHRLIKTETKS